MLFDSWHGLLREIVVGTVAYVWLVTLLRVSGKRTLTKLNAFDLVITVALGSTLASIILSRDVALVEGMLALALLVGLQLAVTWTSTRAARFKHVVKSEPTLLCYRGRLLHSALREQRVTEDELRAAIRAQRVSRMEEVEAAILETDGSFSVLPLTRGAADTAKPDVPGYPAEQQPDEAAARPGS